MSVRSRRTSAASLQAAKPSSNLERGFVINVTRKTVLASTGKVLTSPLRQAVGTMFHRLPGSYVFVFRSPRRVAITNLFVFQTIDILWLDARGAVLALRERFPPFALNIAPPVEACVVIELPEGVIAQSRTRVGDMVSYDSRKH